MPLKSLLNESLEQRGLNKHQLHMEGKIRLGTLHEIGNIGNPDKSEKFTAKQIKLDTLDLIIRTINSLTDDKVGVSDILVYVEDEDKPNK